MIFVLVENPASGSGVKASHLLTRTLSETKQQLAVGHGHDESSKFPGPGSSQVVNKFFSIQHSYINKMVKERGLLQVYHPEEGTTITAE